MVHFAQSPSFILHQVTCQFATGDILFGPLNLSLDASVCALVGRNGSGKTRLLRMLAGVDEPASGHIERFGTHVYVAQQQNISADTTLAELLGYDAIFAARTRIDSGHYEPDDLDTLDGYWDLAERLSQAFIAAKLPPFDPSKRAAELSGGGAFVPCCAAHSPRMLTTCCWTNRPTTSTGKAASGSTSSFPGIRAGCWWPLTTVSCWPRYRESLN